MIRNDLLDRLRCPLCLGRLKAAAALVRCGDCDASWAQQRPDAVNLMPGDFSGVHGHKWTQRQAEMLGWYRDLFSDGAAAADCSNGDHSTVQNVLSRYRGRVLDVGGGVGLARSLMPDEVEYTILDPEDEWIDLAKRVQRTFSTPLVSPDLIVGVAESLPFPDGYFDVALSLWSLNHVADPKTVVAQLARVLRPGGRCLLVLEDLEPAIPGSGETSTTDSSRPVATPQADHLVMSEDDILTWTSTHFVLTRRFWAGRYLALEFVRESKAVYSGSAARGIDWERLRNVNPVTRGFGYDRGQPVDRYYIERFIAANAADISGHVLEVGDATYTARYGAGVSKSSILHVDPHAPGATVVADLQHAPQMASDTFDCVICTQTLQLVYDVGGAIETIARVLKPGGVVLATVPGISQTDDATWSGSWFWSFTPLAIGRLFGEIFGSNAVQVEGHGNVLSATAFLQGLATEDLSREELQHNDPTYPMLVTVRAMKRR